MVDIYYLYQCKMKKKYNVNEIIYYTVRDLYVIFIEQVYDIYYIKNKQ